jgi:aryl-alcohol dehydrogenase-like predicted oxidoreductase
MRTLTLGRTSLSISPLGLGTWAMGGGEYEFGWGPQDDDASEATIRAALAAGITWIDTAPAYGLGRAERLIARALEGVADRPVIFTKCSRLWHDDGTFYSSLRRDSIRRELEGSLERLRVNKIDVYKIHRPWPEEDLVEGWTALAEAKAEGLVDHIGVSYFSPEQLKLIDSIAPVEVIQQEYNLLERTAEETLLPYCEQSGIGVVAYSPMASGLLTGRMTKERIAALPDDDWRKASPAFVEPALTRNLAVVGVLRELAGERGCSLAEVAVAWTLAHPAVQGAIVGARSAEQLSGLLGAADLMLTDEERYRLEEVAAPVTG